MLGYGSQRDSKSPGEGSIPSAPAKKGVIAKLVYAEDWKSLDACSIQADSTDAGVAQSGRATSL